MTEVLAILVIAIGGGIVIAALIEKASYWYDPRA